MRSPQDAERFVTISGARTAKVLSSDLRQPYNIVVSRSDFTQEPEGSRQQGHHRAAIQEGVDPRTQQPPQGVTRSAARRSHEETSITKLPSSGTFSAKVRRPTDEFSSQDNSV